VKTHEPSGQMPIDVNPPPVDSAPLSVRYGESNTTGAAGSVSRQRFPSLPST
jgi:hypothetical protein